MDVCLLAYHAFNVQEDGAAASPRLVVSRDTGDNFGLQEVEGADPSNSGSSAEQVQIAEGAASSKLHSSNTNGDTRWAGQDWSST